MLREGSRIAILGYGTAVQSCLAAADLLQTLNISITVADARFCKPLDASLIRQLVQEHEILITVEEGSIGGFSSHVSNFLGLNGLLDGKLKVIFLLMYKSKPMQIRKSLIIFVSSYYLDHMYQY